MNAKIIEDTKNLKVAVRICSDSFAGNQREDEDGEQNIRSSDPEACSHLRTAQEDGTEHNAGRKSLKSPPDSYILDDDRFNKDRGRDRPKKGGDASGPLFLGEE